MKEITKANFKQELETGVKIVTFSAPWCGPCRMMTPVFEQIEKEEGIEVFKVNVDNEPDLSAEHNIKSVPTIMIFKNGKMVKNFIGAKSKSSIIDEIKSIS